MGIPQAKAPVVDALHHIRFRVVDVPGKGRGVVAAMRIERGELIEKAPVVVVPHSHAPKLDGTVLEHYVYDWAEGQLAVALGSGSLYNHSYAPNAHYVKRFDEGVLEYVAFKDIEAGEEILVNYNGDPTDRTPLWFSVVE